MKSKKYLFLFVILILTANSQAQSMEYSLNLVGRIWFESAEWPSGDTTGGSDVWGWTAPDGEEYAIMGILEGVAFVKASDMTVCDIVLGPSDNDYYYHRDIKTYGHYAYVVAEMTGTDQGLMIIDMSPLPDSVRFVDSSISGSDVRSHNLSIDTATGYAYILKENYSGVRVVTLEDPENPEDVGFISTASIHDVYARNDTVYIAEGSNGSFSIHDLTDKENPQLMTRVDIPASGYVHNIWPSDDGNYVMTTEETTNKTVKMWDIADMNNIEFVGEYLGVNQIAHNTHIMGDFAYISHYTGGIMVVDISDPVNPIEVTRYDTYALNDSPGFYGCWGAYPFTGNGYVYTSDLEGYLTVLQFNVEETVSIENDLGIPYDFSLHQNYPNPFNPVTTINYDIPTDSDVTLTIYDITGRIIKTLINESQQAGMKSIVWNATDVSSGVYIYSIQAGDFTQTSKMIFLK